MHLTGYLVLISGSSSGIGAALAEAFLAAGNSVAITGRNPAASARAPALVTVGSALAFIADASHPVYSATKAAQLLRRQLCG